MKVSRLSGFECEHVCLVRTKVFSEIFHTRFRPDKEVVNFAHAFDLNHHKMFLFLNVKGLQLPFISHEVVDVHHVTYHFIWADAASLDDDQGARYTGSLDL